MPRSIVVLVYLSLNYLAQVYIVPELPDEMERLQHEEEHARGMVGSLLKRHSCRTRAALAPHACRTRAATVQPSYGTHAALVCCRQQSWGGRRGVSGLVGVNT